MLKEKSDLKLQLDKALQDLKALQRSSGGSDAENAKLKEEVNSLKKKLSDTELQLDIIQEQIAAKVEELVNIEKEKMSAVEKMKQMEQECKEMREAEQILTA